MENLKHFRIKDDGVVDLKMSTKFYPLLTNMLARIIEKHPEIMTKIPTWVDIKNKGGQIEANSIEESDFLLLSELSNGIFSKAKEQGLIDFISKEEYEKEIKANGERGH